MKSYKCSRYLVATLSGALQLQNLLNITWRLSASQNMSISAPLAALNAKNTYIALSSLFQPNYKILKLSRQDIISQLKSTIGLDRFLSLAASGRNMHQYENTNMRILDSAPS